MKCVVLLPVKDYILSRRKIWLNYIIAAIPAAIALGYTKLFNVRADVKIDDIFASFINVQISAIAILISFSIAIITILVTSDNENIRQLKIHRASVKNYRPFKNGSTLNLFQVLLSGITYNVLVQIMYLAILVSEIFIQQIIYITALKYLATVNIFFIAHILLTLIDSVVNMYLVFWKDFR